MRIFLGKDAIELCRNLICDKIAKLEDGDCLVQIKQEGTRVLFDAKGFYMNTVDRLDKALKKAKR